MTGREEKSSEKTSEFLGGKAFLSRVCVRREIFTVINSFKATENSNICDKTSRRLSHKDMMNPFVVCPRDGINFSKQQRRKNARKNFFFLLFFLLLILHIFLIFFIFFNKFSHTPECNFNFSPQATAETKGRKK